LTYFPFPFAPLGAPFKCEQRENNGETWVREGRNILEEEKKNLEGALPVAGVSANYQMIWEEEERERRQEAYS